VIEMLNEKIKVKDIMEKDVASVTVPGTRSELLELCKAKYVSGAPVPVSYTHLRAHET